MERKMEKNKIAVLLSSYNGARYIEEQLESIFIQSQVIVDVYIRDDGSTDDTIKIISKYNDRVFFYKGNNVGPSNSFLSLLNMVPQKYDYYAFADQDDVWDTNKLISAINILNKYQDDKPSLYFSALNYVDENLKFMQKKVVDFEPDFKFSLIRSVFPGCTMVFNKKTLELAQTHKIKKQIMHDLFLFQLVSGVDGNIYYDKNSYINYRIHKNNVSVYNYSLVKKIKKIQKDLTINKNSRVNALKELDQHYGKFFTDNNRKLLLTYSNYRHCSGVQRIILGITINDCIKYKIICSASMFLKLF